MQDLGRPRDRFCAPAESWAATVVSLMLVMDSVLHVTTEPEADREVGGDLTVRSHRLVRHRAALGGEGGQPGKPAWQAGIQVQLAHRPGRHVARAVQVDQVQAEPGSQFVICEEPGQHGAAGAAAHVLEQGPVKDGLEVLGRRPECAAKLDANKGCVGSVFHPLCGGQSGTKGKRAKQFRCWPGSRSLALRRNPRGSAAHIASITRVPGPGHGGDPRPSRVRRKTAPGEMGELPHAGNPGIQASSHAVGSTHECKP
jgi:hypothetical protein